MDMAVLEAMVSTVPKYTLKAINFGRHSGNLSSPTVHRHFGRSPISRGETQCSLVLVVFFDIAAQTQYLFPK